MSATWTIPGRRSARGPGCATCACTTLRHSFASRALALGETLPAIGRLLGHSRVETTARYVHLADDSVRQVAIRISDSIADDILGENWRQPSRRHRVLFSARH